LAKLILTSLVNQAWLLDPLWVNQDNIRVGKESRPECNPLGNSGKSLHPEPRVHQLYYWWINIPLLYYIFKLLFNKKKKESLVLEHSSWI
jgi:hypothetical protein